MRSIAEWLLLRLSAAAEFEVGYRFKNISGLINKICGPGKAERTTFGVPINLGIISHITPYPSDLIEVIAQNL